MSKIIGRSFRLIRYKHRLPKFVTARSRCKWPVFYLCMGAETANQLIRRPNVSIELTYNEIRSCYVEL